MIYIENVTKKINNIEIIKNISLDISGNIICGLLGPNGAGKTTIIKMLVGILLPTYGKILVAGNSPNNLEVKKIIGYLKDTNPLYHYLTVKEYLSWIMDTYNIKDKKYTLNKTLLDCGLFEYQNKLINNLSKGYKQRVGIASAIIHNPKVLILDEPTIGLDPLQVIEIRKLIKELSKERTVVLSTNIIQEAETICDEIVIINKGEIIIKSRPIDIINEFNNIIKIVIEGNDSDVLDKIKKIEDVKEIKNIKKVDTIKTYEIVINSSDVENIKRYIYNIIRNSDVILHEFTTKMVDLENIFIKLIK